MISAIPLSVLIALSGVRDGMWSSAAVMVVLVPVLALVGWTAWQLTRPWALQPTRQEEAAPWLLVIGRFVWDALAVVGIVTLLLFFI